MTTTANIKIVRLVYCDDAVRWIRTVFAEPSCRAALPDENRNDQWVSDFCEMLKTNQVVAFMPVVNDCAAGLFWMTHMAAGGMWEVHHFVMPRFRGYVGMKCCDLAAEAAFKEMPRCTHLVGMTRVDNYASIVCARRAGFVPSGVMPVWYRHEGKTKDCLILVRTRHHTENNHG